MDAALRMEPHEMQIIVQTKAQSPKKRRLMGQNTSATYVRSWNNKISINSENFLIRFVQGHSTKEKTVFDAVTIPFNKLTTS